MSPLEASAVWLACVVFGGFAMFAVYTFFKGAPTMQAILVRTHALLFTAAGVVGPVAAGWPGDLTRWLGKKINELGGDLSTKIFGTSIFVGLIVGVLVLCLVITFLPGRWVKRDPWDWLSLAGLILPSVAVLTPGPFGEAVRGLYQAVGLPVADIVQAVIS